MHESGSLLRTILEMARSSLDEPDQSGKYSDDYLARYAVGPAFSDVYGRLALFSDKRPVVQYELQLEKDLKEYVLPPAIQEIWMIVVEDESGCVIGEMVPRSQYNPRGFNWRVEASTLVFDRDPGDRTIHVLYSPAAAVSPHFAADGQLTSADEFTLSAEPEVGALDRRVNAYAGMTLRIIPESGAILERLVRDYDPDTRVATLRLPVTLSSGEYTYEVMPEASNTMVPAVAAAAAIKIGTWRGISQKAKQELILDYKTTMKTLGDRTEAIRVRIGRTFERSTTDAARSNALFLYYGWS